MEASIALVCLAAVVIVTLLPARYGIRLHASFDAVQADVYLFGLRLVAVRMRIEDGKATLSVNGKVQKPKKSGKTDVKGLKKALGSMSIGIEMLALVGTENAMYAALLSALLRSLIMPVCDKVKVFGLSEGFRLEIDGHAAVTANLVQLAALVAAAV